MSSTVAACKIFIASPGGLDVERIAIRDEISEFNQSFMTELHTAFTAHGWEEVPGGLSRPQALINELVRECDFMVLLLGSRWGSQPAVDARYISGTEEEFYVARASIEDADLPMSDILVLFKGVPESQLSDPGPQLQKVLEFKGKVR